MFIFINDCIKLFQSTFGFMKAYEEEYCNTKSSLRARNIHRNLDSFNLNFILKMLAVAEICTVLLTTIY